MNIKELKRRVDEAFKKFPNAKAPIVRLGNELRFGVYVEDEEPSEDNDWSPEGHWELDPELVCLLPEEVEGSWRTKKGTKEIAG